MSIPSTTPTAPVDADTVTGWAELLATTGAGLDDRARIDVLGALEHLKSAAAAAQARVAVDLDTSQRAAQSAAGIRAAKQGCGVATQVALARRESPHRGGRLLGLARALVREMPHTLAALEGGLTNEWRATLVARETACLAHEDRLAVDALVWAVPQRTSALGDRALAGLAGRLAVRLDPQAVVDRSARAARDRHVSVRPAPDTMSRLNGLLPVAQGVACYAALVRAAESARAAGDPRTRGQVMADTLVERLTGRAAVEAVPVSVNLIMTQASLFSEDPEPAVLAGYGAVPAGLARTLAHHADRAGAARVRRLFTDAGTGVLVAADASTRQFRGSLADFIELRDQTCRTPWCDAPIRHRDHIVEHRSGGSTTAHNGQGLCEACNYTKQARGWSARPGPEAPGTSHTVTLTTPTGHTYTSRAPDPPGAPPPRPRRRVVVVELHHGGPTLGWDGATRAPDRVGS